MPATTKPPKRKPAAAAPGHRKHLARRKHDQPKRARLIRSRKRKDPASMRDRQPSALTIPLAMRNGVHVDLVTLPKGVCLLDDESKLLQALEDLLPMVEGLEEFKDNTRWSDRSSISEVFHHFMHKATKLGTGFEAMGIIYRDKYQFKTLQPVWFDINVPAMPVYWIAPIEKVSKSLYELCFYLVRLVRNCGVGLWDEENEGWLDGHIEDGLAHYKANRPADGSNDEEIANWQKAYDEHRREGAATIFLQRLFKSGASKRRWLQAFEDFKPETKLEQSIYKWLIIGKELVECNKFMSEFIHYPGIEDPEYAATFEELPIGPDQLVKFVWRNNDVWFQEFYDTTENSYQNQGAVPFFVEKVIEKPSDFKAHKKCFASILLDFMKEGRALEKKYRKIFEDKVFLKDALCKVKPLIEIL